ncbi:MAG: poly(A) polymerase [Nitrospirota bacterium]|nr:poly(A) polymerase [Nitrospirota bacterium]
MNEQPAIFRRSEHSLSRSWISPNALRVLYRLKESGHYSYLVGGGVRDLLLGREPKDFDIATDARPNEIKKIFRNCRLIGRRFRLAHIHFHDEIIEVATFRSNAPEPEPEAAMPASSAESVAAEAAPEAETSVPSTDMQGPESPPPAPEAPVERPRPPRHLKNEDGMILRDNLFGTPGEDALRRDFTVNALFYNIADFSVIDYVGGMDDLKKGLIRIIGDPRVRFTEDPVRMVRAVRFAAMLGFEIEDETYSALLELRDKVALASNARMYEEIQKLFLLGEGEKVFQLLRKTGLFGVIFPHIDAWLNTEDKGYPRTSVGKALEWVDACVQTGRKIQPHMLFGLMFGQYVEEKWGRLAKSGMIPLEALDLAVAEFLAEQVPRVQIPRKVALAIRDMLWNQGRFEKTRGKTPLYFLRRPGFQDAFEYLRFTSELSGERMELRMWWKEFIRTNASIPVPGAGPQAIPPRESRPPRRRRRRKRPGRDIVK